MSCEANCSVCKEARWFKRLRRNVKSGSRAQALKAIDEVFDKLIYVEEDACYYKCILDGTWPNSVEILEASLRKARKSN